MRTRKPGKLVDLARVCYRYAYGIFWPFFLYSLFIILLFLKIAKFKIALRTGYIFSLLKKAITLLTLIAFIGTTVLSDLALARSDQLGMVENSSKMTRSGLNIDRLFVPKGLGSIKERHDAGSKRVVIHIQDAHCNYNAQRSIIGLIDYFNEKYGIENIGLEGGIGEYDLSTFTCVEDKDTRERVAGYFLKEGRLNAAEYFAVNNPEKVKLFGIEDKDLYINNLKAYRETLKFKNNIDKIVDAISQYLDITKNTIYSNELKDFDALYHAYKDDGVKLDSYIIRLDEIARGLHIRLSDYKNLPAFVDTAGLEKKIDFKDADKERDGLLEVFKDVLSNAELGDIAKDTVEYRFGRISAADYYRSLLKKADELYIDLENYPNLKLYLAYLTRFESIDKERLFYEIESLEDRIKAALCENDDERRLVKLSKEISILKDLFGIQLKNDDYEYYKAHKRDFNIRKFIAFTNVPLNEPETRLIEETRSQMERFYELAYRRDGTFVKNITSHQVTRSPSHQSQDAKIVVTGGFHTENLLKLLRESDISYVSIVPAFDGSDYENPYFRLLAGEKTKLERVVETEIFTLALASFLLRSPVDLRADLCPRVAAMILSVMWAKTEEQAENNRKRAIEALEKYIGEGENGEVEEAIGLLKSMVIAKGGVGRPVTINREITFAVNTKGEFTGAGTVKDTTRATGATPDGKRPRVFRNQGMVEFSSGIREYEPGSPEYVVANLINSVLRTRMRRCGRAYEVYIGPQAGQTDHEQQTLWVSGVRVRGHAEFSVKYYISRHFIKNLADLLDPDESYRVDGSYAVGQDLIKKIVEALAEFHERTHFAVTERDGIQKPFAEIEYRPNAARADVEAVDERLTMCGIAQIEGVDLSPGAHNRGSGYGTYMGRRFAKWEALAWMTCASGKVKLADNIARYLFYRFVIVENITDEQELIAAIREFVERPRGNRYNSRVRNLDDNFFWLNTPFYEVTYRGIIGKQADPLTHVCGNLVVPEDEQGGIVQRGVIHYAVELLRQHRRRMGLAPQRRASRKGATGRPTRRPLNFQAAMPETGPSADEIAFLASTPRVVLRTKHPGLLKSAWRALRSLFKGNKPKDTTDSTGATPEDEGPSATGRLEIIALLGRALEWVRLRLIMLFGTGNMVIAEIEDAVGRMEIQEIVKTLGGERLIDIKVDWKLGIYINGKTIKPARLLPYRPIIEEISHRGFAKEPFMKSLKVIFSPEIIEGLLFVLLPMRIFAGDLGMLGVFCVIFTLAHLVNICFAWREGEKITFRTFPKTLIAPAVIAALILYVLKGFGVHDQYAAYGISIVIHAFINYLVLLWNRTEFAQRHGWVLGYGTIGKEDLKATYRKLLFLVAGIIVFAAFSAFNFIFSGFSFLDLTLACSSAIVGLGLYYWAKFSRSARQQIAKRALSVTEVRQPAESEGMIGIHIGRQTTEVAVGKKRDEGDPASDLALSDTFKEAASKVLRGSDGWVVFADMAKGRLRDIGYGPHAMDFLVDKSFGIFKEAVEQHGGAAARLAGDEIGAVLPDMEETEVERILRSVQKALKEEFMEGRNYKYGYIELEIEQRSDGREAVYIRNYLETRIPGLAVHAVNRVLVPVEAERKAKWVVGVLFKKPYGYYDRSARSLIGAVTGRIPERPEIPVYVPYEPAAAARTRSGDIGGALAHAERAQSIGKNPRGDDILPRLTSIDGGLAEERSGERRIITDTAEIKAEISAHQRRFEYLGYETEEEYPAIKRKSKIRTGFVEGEGVTVKEEAGVDQLLEVIDKVMSSETEGIFFIRGPPDTFYVVRKLETGEVQIIKIKAAYTPFPDRLDQPRLREIIQNAGRVSLPESLRRSANGTTQLPIMPEEFQLVGFKIPQDYWESHALGNDIVTILNLELIHAFESEEVASIGGKLSMAEENFMLSVEENGADWFGFGIALEASVITSGDFQDHPTAEKLVAELDMISEARRSMPYAERPNVRLYKSVITPQKYAEVEGEVLYAKAMTRERMLKRLMQEDERLEVAYAQEIPEEAEEEIEGAMHDGGEYSVNRYRALVRLLSALPSRRETRGEVLSRLTAEKREEAEGLLQELRQARSQAGNRTLSEEVREEAAGRIDRIRRRLAGIILTPWLEMQEDTTTEEDREALRRTLVERLSIPEKQAKSLMRRIVLCEIPREIQLESMAGERRSRVGGLIVRTRAGYRILFPKYRVRDLANQTRDDQGDLLHELAEVLLIEEGLDVDMAHQIALEARGAHMAGEQVNLLEVVFREKARQQETARTEVEKHLEARKGDDRIAPHIRGYLREDRPYAEGIAASWAEGAMPHEFSAPHSYRKAEEEFGPSNISGKEPDNRERYAESVNDAVVKFFRELFGEDLPEIPKIGPEQIMVCRTLRDVEGEDAAGSAYSGLGLFGVSENLYPDERNRVLIHETLHVLFSGFFGNYTLSEAVTCLLEEEITGTAAYNSVHIYKAEALKEILRRESGEELKKAIIRCYLNGDLSALRRRIIEIEGNDSLFVVLMNFELFCFEGRLATSYLYSDLIFSILRYRTYLMKRYNLLNLLMARGAEVNTGEYKSLSEKIAILFAVYKWLLESRDRYCPAMRAEPFGERDLKVILDIALRQWPEVSVTGMGELEEVVSAMSESCSLSLPKGTGYPTKEKEEPKGADYPKERKAGESETEAIMTETEAPAPKTKEAAPEPESTVPETEVAVPKDFGKWLEADVIEKGFLTSTIDATKNRNGVNDAVGVKHIILPLDKRALPQVMQLSRLGTAGNAYDVMRGRAQDIERYFRIHGKHVKVHFYRTKEELETIVTGFGCSRDNAVVYAIQGEIEEMPQVVTRDREGRLERLPGPRKINIVLQDENGVAVSLMLAAMKALLVLQIHPDIRHRKDNGQYGRIMNMLIALEMRIQSVDNEELLIGDLVGMRENPDLAQVIFEKGLDSYWPPITPLIREGRLDEAIRADKRLGEAL